MKNVIRSFKTYKSRWTSVTKLEIYATEMSLRPSWTTKEQEVSSYVNILLLLLYSLLRLEDIKAVTEETPCPRFNEEVIRLSVDIRCIHTHTETKKLFWLIYCLHIFN